MKTIISFLNKVQRDEVCKNLLNDLNILFYPSIGQENQFIFKTNDKEKVFKYLNDKSINFDIINP